MNEQLTHKIVFCNFVIYFYVKKNACLPLESKTKARGVRSRERVNFGVSSELLSPLCLYHISSSQRWKCCFLLFFEFCVVCRALFHTRHSLSAPRQNPRGEARISFCKSLS